MVINGVSLVGVGAKASGGAKDKLRSFLAFLSSESAFGLDKACCKEEIIRE